MDAVPIKFVAVISPVTSIPVLVVINFSDPAKSNPIESVRTLIFLVPFVNITKLSIPPKPIYELVSPACLI